MKRSLILSTFILCSLPAFGSLRSDLQDQLSRNHHPLTYQKAKIELFNYVDNTDGLVCSIYSPSECQRWGVESKYKYRLEHTWPQSLGASELPANSDLHHLFVATKITNSKRANYPFCNVAQSDWEHGGSKLGIDLDLNTCFEPPLSGKGDVARAIFYFAVRYDMELDQKQEEVLRLWHQLDPVSEWEIIRNGKAEELQGNRNIFIDHPELVDQINNF